MRGAEQPPWKMARWGGMLVVGNMLGMLPSMAVPGPTELGGLDLSLLGSLLTPLGCALGVWLVGNIGRWQGGLARQCEGCVGGNHLQRHQRLGGGEGGEGCTIIDVDLPHACTDQ